VATIFQDSMTEVGDGSELDLVLDIDGDTGADDALPVLDMDIGGGSSEIDTVQLEPDVAELMRGPAEAGAGGEAEFGMDSEFQGIFSDDDSGSEDGVGGASLLDFDLGTDLDDTDNVSTIDDDVVNLEDTQLGLRDAPVESADDGDDDHTLVLGLDASGEVDEMQTKLDLAQAYVDMGDSEGARNLLGEVMADGGDEQQQQAREMLTKLS
jgi:pilus assembly protein FimV